MTRLIKSLILSASLAALVCAAPIFKGTDSNSTQPVDGQDPCAVLGGLQTNETTVQHVTSCYNSIEFNATDAKSTLDSLHVLYNDFFIFRDAAMTPDLALPFSSEPVDVLEELKNIQDKEFQRDYDFHAALTLLAQSFNDAHVSYAPECYNSIVFQQPMAFYAPVVNGQQSIRVYVDGTDQDVQDCEVTEINGQDARSFIQAWADKHTGFSKDAGVRLNYALVSHTYSAETQTWSEKMGAFAQRTSLPESDHLNYRIRCDDSKHQHHQKDIHYRSVWTVAGAPTAGTFTDKASFLKNVCLARPKPATGGAPTGAKEDNMGLRHLPPLTESKALTLHRRNVHLQNWANKLKKRADGEEQPSPVPAAPKDFPDATFVAGELTAVYQLKSKPHVGILVLPTMMVPVATEVPRIQSYLVQLAERNVTHIIIDTSGNGGGDVTFAYLMVNIFFPTQDKGTSSHLGRFRVTAAATALSSADLANKEQQTYFEPTSLANKTTHMAFTTDLLFQEPVALKVNGREAEYTDEFYMDYDLTQLNQTVTATLPWTNDTSKVVLLTDGQCGSACGMMSELLVDKHGVSAVAVGGVSGKELSMFSFAGASVLGLDGVLDAFEKLQVAKPEALTRLSYQNTVNIGVIEVYGGNKGLAEKQDKVPLEYAPERHVAKHRLDYSSKTARNHDQLWAAAAETAWA
ncbi:hypothetical protein EDD11_000947 [Mortierella claussenii]|nr:hypothetical protein EDD11_000947 [Mortierella claussenii]